MFHVHMPIFYVFQFSLEWIFFFYFYFKLNTRNIKKNKIKSQIETLKM